MYKHIVYVMSHDVYVMSHDMITLLYSRRILQFQAQYILQTLGDGGSSVIASACAGHVTSLWSMAGELAS